MIATRPEREARALGRRNHRRGVEQAPDARVERFDNRVASIAGDERSIIDDAEAIAERERLAHVVRDDDHRLVQLILDAAELLLQLGARHRVQRAEGFIHQKHGGIHRQRTRHTHPLPLAARQLVGPPRGELGREPDQVEQLRRPRRDPLGRPSLQPRDDPDVLFNRHVGEKSDVLQHVPHPAPQPDRIPLARVTAFDHDASRIRKKQPVGELEQRGLPTRCARRGEHCPIRH